MGWYPGNSNTAYLTGIIQPQGVSDPYIYNTYLSIQREVASKLVLEADYVGTVGHKLFRSENLNALPGGRLPLGACVTDNFGRQVCGQNDTNLADGTANPNSVNPLGRLNPNYGTMREWQNDVNSSYNALQFTAKKQMSHGLLLNANYTWAHSIDNGSGWHQSATGANGAAAGDGYSTDQTIPGLDRGNSIFDIRHRLVVNYVYQIPGPRTWIRWRSLGGMAVQWDLGLPKRRALGTLYLKASELKRHKSPTARVARLTLRAARASTLVATTTLTELQTTVQTPHWHATMAAAVRDGRAVGRQLVWTAIPFSPLRASAVVVTWGATPSSAPDNGTRI